MQKQKVYVVETGTHFLMCVLYENHLIDIGSLPLDGTLVDLARWMERHPDYSVRWGRP